MWSKMVLTDPRNNHKCAGIKQAVHCDTNNKTSSLPVLLFYQCKIIDLKQTDRHCFLEGQCYGIDLLKVHI